MSCYSAEDTQQNCGLGRGQAEMRCEEGMNSEVQNFDAGRYVGNHILSLTNSKMLEGRGDN